MNERKEMKAPFKKKLSPKLTNFSLTLLFSPSPPTPSTFALNLSHTLFRSPTKNSAEFFKMFSGGEEEEEGNKTLFPP